MSQNQPGMQAGGAARPGQMTAVMRAMQVAAGPKVLHIGLYQGSKAVEERIIKSRTTVTVGNNEKNTFVLAVPQLPATFKLFELIGSDYYLNFFDGFRGRLALASGITDIADLKGQAKAVGNYYQIKLTEEARGQILIGDRKLLFHFVAPPPVQPKPQLPLAVVGAAAGIDWTLMIIASFSFLAHFGVVGALYSDWLDPPWHEASLDKVVDLLKNIPVPPTPEAEKKPDDTDKNKAADKPDPKAASASSGAKAAGGAAAGAGPKGAVGDKQAAALAKAAESMEVALLGALGGTTAAEGALRRSEIPGVDLSAVAASGAGATAGTSDLKVGGGGGGPVQAGAGGGGGLGNIGSGTGGSGTGQTAGTETKVKGPTGDVGDLRSQTVGAPVSNADRVVAGLRGRFKACYQRGLAEDPTMSGKVTLVAKVGPNGEVTSVSPTGVQGLSPTVVSCLQGHVNRASFDAPGGAGSTIQIPVSFVQQGK